MPDLDKNTAVMAFTEDQVLRLTGLTRRQVRYWHETGFFAPSFGEGHVFYSFRDLVGLRTIAILREQLPLQELRKLGQWLESMHETPWASLTFYLVGKTVFIQDWKTDSRVTHSPPGQLGLTEFPMTKVVSDVLSAVKADRSRKQGQLGHVEKKRGVMNSQDVVAGTRVKTSAIWDFHDAGYTAEQICEQYPTLTTADVEAALAHERALRKVG